MFRKLLALVLLLSATTPAFAGGELTDAEVFAIAGPKTCQDGGFTDVADRELSIPILTLDPNILYEYCFRLPRLRKKDLGSKTSGLVELNAINLGDSSCGTASAFLIRPDRKPLIGSNANASRTYADLDSSQPAGILFYTPGVWRVLIRYEEGCNKYTLNVNW